MPAEAPVVLFGGRVTVHRLQIGDEELGGVGPVAGRQGLGLQVLLDGIVRFEHGRRRHVAMDGVVEGRDVGAALDGGVPAQRHIPPPGRPMLPSTSCSMAAAPIIWTPCCAGSSRRRSRWRRSCPDRSYSAASPPPRRPAPGAAGDLGDHIRRVAGEVLLHVLEDAARVFQGRISFGRRRFQVPHQRVVGWSGGNRGSPRSGGIPSSPGWPDSTPCSPDWAVAAERPWSPIGSRVLPGLRVVLTDEAVETHFLPHRTESGETPSGLSSASSSLWRKSSWMMVAALV